MGRRNWLVYRCHRHAGDYRGDEVVIRKALFLVLFGAIVGHAQAQFPTPVVAGMTVTNSAQSSPLAPVPGQLIVQGSVSVHGTTALSGGGSFTGTFGGLPVINNLVAGLYPTPLAGLSGISNPVAGDMVYVTDCVNGGQIAPGTGCPAFYNAAGTWVTMPTPTTLQVTVGGQAISLGGSTLNQGIGPKIQTASGTTNNGDCAQFNSSGTLIDSGGPCSGGTGGSGTVTVAPQFAVPYYSAAGSGSALAGMAVVNNAVVATNGSGVPAETTSLPIGLVLPNALITSPTLTGAISIAAAQYTGRQQYAPSSVSNASSNVPVGVAPTTPLDGDHWRTTAGVFDRIGGVTLGPILYSVQPSFPLANTSGGSTGPTEIIGCPLCLVSASASGGVLTTVAPLQINATGPNAISLAAMPRPLTWIADSAYVVHNDVYPLILAWPLLGSGSVQQVWYSTGGTTSPSFNLSLSTCTNYPGGSCTAIPGCNNITVSSSTPTYAACSGIASSIATGQTLLMTISGVTGSPSSAVIQPVVTFPGA
jgi:hypothetical protein